MAENVIRFKTHALSLLVFPFNYLIYRAFVAVAVVVCLRTPMIYGYNTRPLHIAYTCIIIAIVPITFTLHLFQVFLFFLIYLAAVCSNSHWLKEIKPKTTEKDLK